MSILSAVIRSRPKDLNAVVARMQGLPGVDLAINPGDGRLVLVIEDALAGDVMHGAAHTLAGIAAWPEVLNTSLVWEYSGPDAPPTADAALMDFQDWRGLHGGKKTRRGNDAQPTNQ